MSTNQQAPIRVTGDSVAISATTTSADEAISVPHGRAVVSNTGSVWAYLKTGIGAQTAVVATSYPLAPDSQQTISIPTDHNTAAAITEAGSTTVRVTPVMGE